MLRIVNATPLIYLAKLGKLSLARTLYPILITTPQVRNEVLIRNRPEYNVLNDAFENWIEIREVNDKQLLEQIREAHNIHEGEASILSLAIECKEDILLFIDDKSARAIAKSFGFQVSGTLGIVVASISNSLLSKTEALQVIDQLALHTPFRMSLELYKLITEKINEMGED